MVYAHLQLGQDKRARLSWMRCWHPERWPGRFPRHYALAAPQARYMVERGDWKGAAELQVRPGQFNYTVAITHFARALGAARAGNPVAAKADIAKLAELARQAARSEGRLLVGDRRHSAAGRGGVGAHAQGKYDEALRAMSAAADAEDRTEKHPVTPGRSLLRASSMAPCCLSAAWRRRRRAAFEATLKKGAHTGWVRRSAQPKPRRKLGDAAQDASGLRDVVALTGEHRNCGRTVEIAEARTFVAKR